MRNQFEMHPLVSVVIPIYNAEKFLGYCLNSIMSQSYANIEVIMMNDGSTDCSPEICRKYAAIDPRFSVYDIPNGGVSNARNLGVQKTHGDYLLFVDSDDMIHPETIEWMLAAEEQAEGSLVVGDVQFVDFETAEVLPTLLCGAYVGEHHAFTHQEFRQNEMRLIWHTSLMEGLYGKLYNAKTWKENAVHCPTDVSLGEDFLANMQYYAACQGVSFLGKTVYYYNNIQNSNSLSHKYRPDLFENKMMLMKALEKHLGGVGNMSHEEQVCFHDYVASSGLYCVDSIFKTHNTTEEEKRQALCAINGDGFFMNSLKNAEYIHPQYACYVPQLLTHEIEEAAHQPVPEKETISSKETKKRNKPVGPHPGIMNRATRKCLRAGVRLFHSPSLARRLLTVEQSIADVGLKHTAQLYSPQARKRRASMTDMDHVLQKRMEPFAERIQHIEDAIADSNRKIEWVKADAEVSARSAADLFQKQFSSLQDAVHSISCIIQDMHQEAKSDAEVSARSTADLFQEQFGSLQDAVRSMSGIIRDMHQEAKSDVLEAVNRLDAPMKKIQEQIAVSAKETIQEQRSLVQKAVESVPNILLNAQQERANIILEAIHSVNAAVAEMQQLQVSVQDMLHHMPVSIEEALDAQIKDTQACMEQLTSLAMQAETKLEQLHQMSIDTAMSKTQEIKDYVYLSEQRQSGTLHRLVMNELRQRKKAVLLGTAEHRNIGDAAITLAEQCILRQQFPNYFQVEYSTYEQPEQYEFIRSIINDDDIIFIHGGGNLGSLYPTEEELHRRILMDFPENKIVIFPQTIFFSDDEDGRKELALSKPIYNAHKDLTIFARGKKSLAFAQVNFANARSFLMPDAVFALQKEYHEERSGVLLCLRDDQESVLTSEQRQQIIELLQGLGLDVTFSNNMASEDISREQRSRVVNDELRRYAQRQLVVTDRLHGMIFAAVTGTPVVIMQNGNYKIDDFINSFMSQFTGVSYIYNGALSEKILSAAHELLTLRTGKSAQTDGLRSEVSTIRKKVLDYEK